MIYYISLTSTKFSHEIDNIVSTWLLFICYIVIIELFYKLKIKNSNKRNIYIYIYFKTVKKNKEGRYLLNYLKYTLGWRREESQGKESLRQPEFVQIISLYPIPWMRTTPPLVEERYSSHPIAFFISEFQNPLFFCLIIRSNLSWKRFVKREQLRDWSKLLLDQISPNLPFTMVHTISLSLSLSLITKLIFLKF